jgi:hypothetical protein
VPIKVPETGRYRLLMRTANTANTLHVTSPSLGYDQTLELRSPSSNVKFFPTADVYATDRVAVDTSAMTVSAIESSIPDELVPVNFGYSYQDLGVIDAKAGSHTIAIDKSDNNPMLFEGMMLVPEAVYENLTLPSGVVPIENPNDLQCSERTESTGATDGYVDAAANPEHANLTQDELIALAAADVQDLAPPEGGVVGSSWIGIALTALLLVGSGLLVRWRARLHPDDEPEERDASDRPDKPIDPNGAAKAKNVTTKAKGKSP